jgi:hypothetical protein
VGRNQLADGRRCVAGSSQSAVSVCGEATEPLILGSTLFACFPAAGPDTNGISTSNYVTGYDGLSQYGGGGAAAGSSASDDEAAPRVEIESSGPIVWTCTVDAAAIAGEAGSGGR